MFFLSLFFSFLRNFAVLASWFRLKYPHIALGAVAASAPILYFDTDDAEKFTSEMHDPCTRSRYLQERTTQKHL